MFLDNVVFYEIWFKDKVSISKIGINTIIP